MKVEKRVWKDGIKQNLMKKREKIWTQIVNPKCRKDTIKIKIAIYLSSEVLNAESDENVENDTHI